MAERRLKLAVSAGVLDLDVRVAVGVARELGVEGVEVNAYAAGMRLPDLSGTGRREFRHMLAGERQELAAVRVDCGAKGLGLGADVDRVINGVDRAMEAARGLSAGVVTVEVGLLPEPVREVKEKPKITGGLAGLIIVPDVEAERPARGAAKREEPDPAFVAQVDGAMRELGRRADRYGVAVAFHSELSSYAAVERAIVAAGCPWFGIDLDPAGVLQDEWGMGEVLSRMGSLVRHVRGRDAVRGAEGRTRPAVIGRGEVDWGEVVALLDEAGYHGWVTIDPMEMGDRVGAVRAGVEYLRGMG